MRLVYIYSISVPRGFRLLLACCLVLVLSHPTGAVSALAASGILDGETVSIETVQLRA